MDNQHMKCIKLWLILLVAFTSACASLQAGGEKLPVPSQWKLVSFGKSGAETPVLTGSTITIEFDEKDRVGGSGGCNAYGASYETKGNSITFKDLISTLMACVDERVNQQEQQYFKALQSATEYKISGDNLVILYDEGQSTLNFVKQ